MPVEPGYIVREGLLTDIRPRITFARFLIRLGKLIESLAVMVMRPDDLIEFSRRWMIPHAL